MIEDRQRQRQELEHGSTPKTIERLQAFAETVTFDSQVLSQSEREAIESDLRVVSIDRDLGAQRAAIATLARRPLTDAIGC